MSNLNPIANPSIKAKVIQNSWDYLHDNFHKFNETNKIKVVLAVISKDMPTKVEGGFNINQMPTALVDKKPLETDIGTNPT